MCGRFTLSPSPEVLAEVFQLAAVPDLSPRYNIAPTQSIAAILQTESGRYCKLLRWGLIPAWAKDPQMGARLINARSETVAEKPSFRSAFRQRRCLIPADGFYEWQRTKTGKQPFYFRMQDGSPFAFAGLWERWQGNGTTEAINTCTILTTEANSLLKPIHDRMPVILQPQDYATWLAPTTTQGNVLQSLLRPYEAALMTAFPVTSQVNYPGNDTPDCIQADRSQIDAGLL
ncbi:hypothetical protein BST81_16175 [Leptolyngbya sp. 'hensonii']|uniref:SOS response-associated peptidase n=1 Tax=Leptolyngbya sp. 'hensonii' TaxID=1922337 RepID=UPI0009500DE2|nr:SOS response-associated peptidase [Leptolyngbya sp. 'hensonii']OLP17339.1 hypothetical protein BST81_16175 [Leptolyngbya sp. 'hensonii']